MFSGKPRDVETFLVSILDVIELLRRTLATNCERSLYMGTALGEGSTQTWYVSICTNEPNLLDNFEEFVKHFRKHFTYVDVKHDTMHKIKIMGQDTYSACSQFYTQFKSQLRYLNISDSTKISLFYDGLKSRVKDTLLTIPKHPKVWNEFAKLCISIDNTVCYNDVQ